ncbi:MAG: hypothetical protein IPG96_06915 [Proteobacteria bacterium]|nr:hypothetical protein [Pseudomonadota bacterium]
MLRCDASDGLCGKNEAPTLTPSDCRTTSCGDGKCSGAEEPVSCAADCPDYRLPRTLGAYHTCARLASGSARCWGSNSDGQLGDGSQTDRPTTTVVSGLTSVAELALGGFHSCARLGDATVRCWGRNADGQLGNATTTASLTSVVVKSLTGAAGIALGTYRQLRPADGRHRALLG